MSGMVGPNFKNPTPNFRTYGSSETFLADAGICQRNWLHRHQLIFQDAHGQICVARCELPMDLRQSLENLREQNSEELVGAIKKTPED